MRIKLYVEGGGDDNEALRAVCRKGFRLLFEDAGFKGQMPHIVAGGSRNRTFKKFLTAAGSAGANEFVCLLVDSEGPVAEGASPWAVLKWQQPPGVTDENAHLMVQCMESWFLADPQALERFFGHDNLPKRKDVEKIPKNDVFTALARASNGRYQKGRLSFELLGTLDANRLATASFHAKRLFSTLRRRAQGPEA